MVDSDQRNYLIQQSDEHNVLFPLTSTHYIENWSHGNADHRRLHAAEMGRLSKFLAIAPLSDTVEREVRRAVQQTFGREVGEPSINPFGIGCIHALGSTEPDGIRAMSKDARLLMELNVLSANGAEDKYEAEHHARSEADSVLASSQTKAMAKLALWTAPRAERTRRFRIQTLSDSRDILNRHLIGNDIAVEEFAALDDEALEGLLRAMPTLWALTELRRVRFANPLSAFKKSDPNDLRFLALALAYSDVVLVDKAWTDAVRRTALGVELDVRVVARISDVVSELKHATFDHS